MIILYTPATGFLDLEIKIAYGLARVGSEAYGANKVTIQDDGGFYSIKIQSGEDKLYPLEETFNLLCRRLLSSSFIPFATPGIGGRSASSIAVRENETFSLKHYLSIKYVASNIKSENACKHESKSVGNIIGFTASTSRGVEERR